MSVCTKCGAEYEPGGYHEHKLTHSRPGPRASDSARNAAIVEQWRAGATGVEIATAFGISRERVRMIVKALTGESLLANRPAPGLLCAVCGAAYKRGAFRVHCDQAGHQLTAQATERVDAITKLYAQGMSTVEISAELGVPIQRVAIYLHRVGVPMRRQTTRTRYRQWTAADRARILELRSQGMSWTAIAREFRSTFGWVRQQARQAA